MENNTTYEFILDLWRIHHVFTTELFIGTMKKIQSFILLVLVAVAPFLTAQAQNANLDSLLVTITEPGSETAEIKEVNGENDTIGIPDLVQLNVCFYADNPANLDSLTVSYGSSIGSSDILGIVLERVAFNGKDYLLVGNRVFPFSGKKVMIKKLISRSTLINPSAIQLIGKSTNGNYTNTLSANNIK